MFLFMIVVSTAVTTLTFSIMILLHLPVRMLACTYVWNLLDAGCVCEASCFYYGCCCFDAFLVFVVLIWMIHVR